MASEINTPRETFAFSVLKHTNDSQLADAFVPIVKKFILPVDRNIFSEKKQPTLKGSLKYKGLLNRQGNHAESVLTINPKNVELHLHLPNGARWTVILDPKLNHVVLTPHPGMSELAQKTEGHIKKFVRRFEIQQLHEAIRASKFFKK
ncbi:hypothetical protein HY989_04610 [Candidatus Micrarchaeota archaeon]|nr:hypothetical protein [Candidatus Micrarchaeota archaeon]